MMSTIRRSCAGRLVGLSSVGEGRPNQRSSRRRRREPLGAERLDERVLLSVTIAPTNNSGNGYVGLDFNQSNGGFIPPDTSGAAGPNSYVETVNQTIAIFSPKSTGSSEASISLSNFWSVIGGLPPADANSRLSDPIVVFDDNLSNLHGANGRFIVGDQDVNFNTHVSRFNIAVSKSSNPTTLSPADWAFYQIDTTEVGFDADYPGNFGYNNDAFVFTLNQFAVVGNGIHTEVFSVNAANLAAGVSQIQLGVFHKDINDYNLRPAALHDAAPGSPMWIVTDFDGAHINVYKLTNLLSNSPTVTNTLLSVNPYTDIFNVKPRQPDGTVVVSNLDSRILKAAGAGNTLVAAQAVSLSGTQDAARWYKIDVSGGTPVLQDQGDVTFGNNTYSYYPGIDINPAGDIGMTFMSSATAAGKFMSMYVTGRKPTDPPGTMETPVLVPAGTGLTNYHDFGGANNQRAGDLSGINVDPVDGTFWASNEFANTEATANWGTAIANFSLGTAPPSPSADISVTKTGPPTIIVGPGGTNVVYTITVANAGPDPALSFVLTDTLPAGSIFVSMAPAGGNPDAFLFNQLVGSVTESLASFPAGHTDVFTLTVFAPGTLTNGAAFNNTATVFSLTFDPSTANNSATALGTVVVNAPTGGPTPPGVGPVPPRPPKPPNTMSTLGG